MLDALRRTLLPSSPGALRLWLAMVVVFHHVSQIEVGKAPVLVFFALSGYWVCRVWQDRYRHARQPWLTFVISRWWRVAPVMLLATVLSFTALWGVGSAQLAMAAGMAPQQFLSSVFVLGYAMMPVRPVGPAWSLDIEMQFYLVAPLLVLLVRRIPANILLLFTYSFYALCLMAWPEMVLTSFIFPFVLGIVAAQHKWTVSPRLAEGAQALAVTLVIAAWVSPWKPMLLETANDSWWPAFNILLAALVLPQALVSVQSRGSRMDRIWADQSYIVYMLHWPAIVILRGIAWTAEWQWWVALGGLALVVASGCAAVLRWYDRPLNRARARWVDRRGRMAGEALEPGTKRDDSAPLFA